MIQNIHKLLNPLSLSRHIKDKLKPALAMLLLLWGAVSWQACETAPPEQPKVECDSTTTRTENKFSMKVNGVHWESCAPWHSNGRAGDGQYWRGSGLLQVFGRFACGEMFGDTLFSDVALNLQTWANSNIDTFVLGGFHGAILSLKYPPQFINPDHFHTDSLHTGQVILTRFDTVARLVSGTFEFRALTEDSTKTVEVTEGKFCNVRYDWQ